MPITKDGILFTPRYSSTLSAEENAMNISFYLGVDNWFRINGKEKSPGRYHCPCAGCTGTLTVGDRGAIFNPNGECNHFNHENEISGVSYPRTIIGLEMAKRGLAATENNYIKIADEFTCGQYSVIKSGHYNSNNSKYLEFTRKVADDYNNIEQEKKEQTLTEKDNLKIIYNNYVKWLNTRAFEKIKTDLLKTRGITKDRIGESAWKKMAFEFDLRLLKAPYVLTDYEKEKALYENYPKETTYKALNKISKITIGLVFYLDKHQGYQIRTVKYDKNLRNKWRFTDNNDSYEKNNKKYQIKRMHNVGRASLFKIAHRGNVLFLTEGAFDALSVGQIFNIADPNVKISIASTQGCGNHTDAIEYAKELNESKLCNNDLKVVILYDDDEAGQKGYEKIKEKLEANNLFVAPRISYNGFKDINEWMCNDYDSCSLALTQIVKDLSDKKKEQDLEQIKSFDSIKPSSESSKELER